MNATTTPALADIRSLMGAADAQLAGLRPEDEREPLLRSVQQVRRRRTRGGPDGAEGGFLTLVRDENGVFDWQVDGGPQAAPDAGPMRRAARRGALFDVEPVDQALFRTVPGSQVTEWLDKLDGNFNPRYGLYDLAGKAVDGVPAAGRVLLVIHGTFSRSEAITVPFAALLKAAQGAYDRVLVYEHPTLAVSPLLNALDLARAFAGSRASVDVIAHSRGGLVARWWLEVLDRGAGARARVVFFGSPLMGTALASPYKLRAALKLLTNVAIAARGTAQLVSLAVPLFTVVQGLMTLVASAGNALTRTPLADAAVAMVPGLASMSLYGQDGGDRFLLGNHELRKLGFGLAAAPAGYHVVRSNFEPSDEGWKFWRLFRNAKERIGDQVADVLFEGHNDLVVDTPSMSRLSPELQLADPARILDFGTSPTVHHLNYFEQPQSAAFVRQVLGF